MLRHRLEVRIAAFAGPAVLSLFGFAPGAAFAQECDRACLTGMMTQFIDAVVAHDPSTLPLTDNVKYTEDSRNARLDRSA
jgi:hypothetical protein